MRRDDGEPHKHTEDLTHTQKDDPESCDKLLTQRQEVAQRLCSHLDGDEDEGDDELGGGADEFGRGHRPLALLEDAVDAVGFGQHGGVGDGHAEAQQEAPECTSHRTWLRDHQEGDQVDQEDTCREGDRSSSLLMMSS